MSRSPKSSSMSSSVSPLALVETEALAVSMALRRVQLWSRSSAESERHPVLLASFAELKKFIRAQEETINLDELDPMHLLMPFLETIRSEQVSGPVTGLALDAVMKFVKYGVVNARQRNASVAIEAAAEAVTHARFVGVDSSADEVVLMKIMNVLHSIVTAEVGRGLSNEGVCEIMQSTFRICFESRLSELLRKTGEHALTDIVHTLFTRLGSMSNQQDSNLPMLKRLKMRGTQQQSAKTSKSKQQRSKRNQQVSSVTKAPAAESAKTPETAAQISKSIQDQANKDVRDGQQQQQAQPQEQTKEVKDAQPQVQQEVQPQGLLEAQPEVQQEVQQKSVEQQKVAQSEQQEVQPLTQLGGLQQQQQSVVVSLNESVATPTMSTSASFSVDADVLARSPLGSVTDLTAIGASNNEGNNVSVTVTSPQGSNVNLETEVKDTSEVATIEKNAIDKDNECKSDNEVFVNAQGVTFAATSDKMDSSTGALIPFGLPCVRELYRFLITLIRPQDSQERMIQTALTLLSTALEAGACYLDKFDCLLALTKDELARNLVSLLSSERVSLFSSCLWIALMLFRHQRRHLKFQMELFLSRLIEVLSSESTSVSYEHKELALEAVVRLFRIPGFITQLYLNYDCDTYTSNMLEDLTKMLSKHTFPVSGVYSTNLLSLEALLAIVEDVERHCQRMMNARSTTKSVTADNQRKTEKELKWKSDSNANDGVDMIPSHEAVMAVRHRKKLLTTATEQFNAKPSKGIAYLQENNLLNSPLDPNEVASFIRENPHLCKKQVGEYVSNRKNLSVLDAFVRSFHFEHQRLDESLRLFLEAFRLPGEAPLITLVLEHFADHWQKSNGNPFVDADAAFTLSYAVIMLNVDQHNKNHTKTNDPMTEEEFMRNLRGTNGGKDHDPDMLREIYHAIKHEEIVMPAEQTGLVRENYLWKCVLKRGQDASFIVAPNGYFDHDVFSIVWGPAVASLCYVFDRSNDKEVIDQTIQGFQRCAIIASHYEMSDVFDNLIISLCKFTNLHQVASDTEEAGQESSEDDMTNFVVSFGSNQKAMLATRLMFHLVQRHGDILRDGWRNVVEVLLQLFKCQQLLPRSMMEAEDFLESTGRVKIFRSRSFSSVKAEASGSFLTSFVSFISMSTEASGPRILTSDEESCVTAAQTCIQECNIESLLSESKFLLPQSLLRLVKLLIEASSDLKQKSSVLFFLELLTRVTVYNKDRAALVFTQVHNHVAQLIVNSHSKKDQFVLERGVTALLRLCVRLSRKEELASSVVKSLAVLLTLKTQVVSRVSRHVAFGLFELLRNSAANIHSEEEWQLITALLEVVGAGCNPQTIELRGVAVANAQANEDSGLVTSSDPESQSIPAVKKGREHEETEKEERHRANVQRQRSDSVSSGSNGDWTLLGENSQQPLLSGQNRRALLDIQAKFCSTTKKRAIVMHDSMSYLKCVDSLSFLVKDMAHVTRENFGDCLQAIRTFVDVAVLPTYTQRNQARINDPSGHTQSQKKPSATPSNSALSATAGRRQARSAPAHRPRRGPAASKGQSENYDADESDEEQDDLATEYENACFLLLDLMFTLHSKASYVFCDSEEKKADEDQENVDLWVVSWCPLLQGMAVVCSDRRARVRKEGQTALQRAFLYPDMRRLNAQQWESAFHSVLFPMLQLLLLKPHQASERELEETRVRAVTLLGKVFLQHLQPLATLGTFQELWSQILDYLAKFHASSFDLLADAIPEALKNLLLVMDASGVFLNENNELTELWKLTWDKAESFLPGVLAELFPERERERIKPKEQMHQGGSQQNQMQKQEQSGQNQLQPQQETLEQNQQQMELRSQFEPQPVEPPRDMPENEHSHKESKGEHFIDTSNVLSDRKNEEEQPVSPMDPPFLPASAIANPDSSQEPSLKRPAFPFAPKTTTLPSAILNQSLQSPLENKSISTPSIPTSSVLGGISVPRPPQIRPMPPLPPNLPNFTPSLRGSNASTAPPSSSHQFQPIEAAESKLPTTPIATPKPFVASSMFVASDSSGSISLPPTVVNLNNEDKSKRVAEY